MQSHYTRRDVLVALGTLTGLLAGVESHSMPLNAVPRAGRTPRFRVVDIGVPDEDRTGRVECYKISSDGRYVVGNFQDRGGMHAFVWKDGVFEECSRLQSDAVSVNTKGVAVGSTVSGTGRSPSLRATLWKNGKETFLFSNTGASDCQDIDDAGNIYGHHHLDTWRGFIRSPNGKVRYIEEGTKRYCLVLCGNGGRVCGVFTSNDYKEESSELYDDGKLIPLLSTTGDPDVRPKAINKNGVVVGGGGKPFVPLLWRKGKPEVLPGLPANWRGSAAGINTNGDVVGMFHVGSSQTIAPFLCRKAKCYDLNGLLDRSGLELFSVQGISDNGIILVTGWLQIGNKPRVPRGYLLVPK